jgi:hypothetical protein
VKRVAMRTKALIATAILVTSVSAAWAQDGHSEKPCSAPEYSQFDFWVGDWQVTSPDGKPLGANRIAKILGGCAIQENWAGAGGSIGQSYNIYAKARGVWHQTWVDNSGSLLVLDGGIEDGRMVLRGETPARDGKGTVMHEISWTPMATGQVRQHWQISRDGGGEWSDAFVGIYSRKHD